MDELPEFVPVAILTDEFPVRCPNTECGNGDITYADIEFNSGTVWQSCACNICGAEWDEVYKPDRIEITKPGEIASGPLKEVFQ